MIKMKIIDLFMIMVMVASGVSCLWQPEKVWIGVLFLCLALFQIIFCAFVYKDESE